jgi:hypothetical protein
MRTLAAALLFTLLPAAAARAQRTVTQDTLSRDTPVALTCGFCGGERFGAIFRELPAPFRGLEPGDFPLRLHAVQVAMASATLVTGAGGGYTCEGRAAGGTALGDVEVYAGTMIPTGAILSQPADMPWPGETLVWAATEVPLSLSTAEMDGSSRYEVMFNRLLTVGAMDAPIDVAAPASYLRVAVTLGTGMGTSASCVDMMLPEPTGFPMRDADGRIAMERSYIYASGAGFLWNEEARVNGDWGIRVEVEPLGGGTDDGGVPDTDGGADVDGGADTDAGSATDAGTGLDAGSGGGDGGDDGCGCRIAGRRRASHAAGALGLGALAAMFSRARRRRRSSR